MNTIMFVLAQESARPPSGGGAGGALFLPALMIAVVTFMLLSSRSQKKREKREKDDMHARMAKNDRVLTIGGVIGTVLSVKDSEVVLKVDESTNTKMTFVKTAIQKIITEDQPASSDKR